MMKYAYCWDQLAKKGKSAGAKEEDKKKGDLCEHFLAAKSELEKPLKTPFSAEERAVLLCNYTAINQAARRK